MLQWRIHQLLLLPNIPLRKWKRNGRLTGKKTTRFKHPFDHQTSPRSTCLTCFPIHQGLDCTLDTLKDTQVSASVCTFVHPQFVDDSNTHRYEASDVMARYWRMKGYDVLHPIGWDSFGLPAEQFAIQTGAQPAETTKTNIANFKRQLKMLGFSYDWDREIATTDMEYVHWTQWIFLQVGRIRRPALVMSHCSPMIVCNVCSCSKRVWRSNRVSRSIGVRPWVRCWQMRK